MNRWKSSRLRWKFGLVWCLFLSSVILLPFHKKSGLRDATIPLPFSLPPCGHDVDKDKGQISNSGDLEMTRTMNATLDNFYINNHWAEPLNVVPIAHGKLIHVHNVCVKGGDNGLVVPHLGGLFKAFGYMDRKYFPESSHPIAFREFTYQELLGLFGTTADREKHNVKHVDATLVPGRTYFMNCWSRSPGDDNPAHWLMKIHMLFELAQVVKTTHSLSLMPFDNLAFHQCASYDRVVRQGLWPWGKNVFEAATRDWLAAGLWKGLEQVRVVEMNFADTEWTCFEDIVFETQYGNWFPATPYMSKWRHNLLESVGLRDDNSVPDDGLSERCLSNRLRIHVFKRTEGRGLREFVNMDEVVALAQTYTSLPIEVITINSTTSVQDQATLFRAFDLLISSHGSQIANIIFTDPERTGIIEVLPVVRDRAFANNAGDAGFLSYIVSTGHAPFPEDTNLGSPCINGSENMKRNCWTKPGTDIWDCDFEWSNRLTSCNTFVNITILRTHIEATMTKLCAL